MTKQQIGVIGLDDLGKDLALNIESLGYSVSVFNHLMFVKSIIRPGNILIMVKTDRQTDFTINALKPFIQKGDIIVVLARELRVYYSHKGLNRILR